jgi:phosphoglycerate dehydrogenase-like enzyme
MVVLGSIYEPITRALRARLPKETVRSYDRERPLIDQVGDVEVLMLGGFTVDAALMKRAPQLRLIHQHGRGYERVDLPEATSRGILVCNVLGDSISTALAEHALSLILALAKGLTSARGAIERRVIGDPVTSQLSGKTLGIVGFGESGRKLAAMAKALGMRVLATRLHPEPSSAADFVGGPDDLPRLLRESDFVSLHVSMSDRTRGMIGEKELALMKRSAHLVDVARALLVDYAALLRALEERRIAGAAFDVAWREPIDPADPILKLDNFLLTPHLGGFSDSAVEEVADLVAANIVRWRSGQLPERVVNR